MIKDLWNRWNDIGHPLIKWGGALVVIIVGIIFLWGLLGQWWV